MLSLRVSSKSQAKPYLRNTVSQRQTVVGSGLSQKDPNILSQHLICVTLLQLPQNSQCTVTKPLLHFVNSKNKHKGSFCLRNSKETGKHR